MRSPLATSSLARAGASARTAATNVNHLERPTLGAKTGLSMRVRALPPMVVRPPVAGLMRESVE